MFIFLSDQRLLVTKTYFKITQKTLTDFPVGETSNYGRKFSVQIKCTFDINFLSTFQLNQ